MPDRLPVHALIAIFLLSPFSALAETPSAPCTDSYACFERLPLETLCGLTYEIPAAEDLGPYDPCTHENEGHSIAFRAKIPLGGMTYVAYRLVDDLDRLDFRVTFRAFEPRAGLYLQLYEGTIGKAHFYFGIQSGSAENARMLIFSRWFADEEIAAVMGLDKVSACRALDRMPYRNKVLVYKKFAEAHPAAQKAFEKHVRASVETNREAGGFSGVATYEGAFAGVSVPNVTVARDDVLLFSLVRGADDAKGRWYRYKVKNESSGRQLWVGSIRFPKGALIGGNGVGWTELFAPLQQAVPRGDDCQHYEDLPTHRFVIEPLLSYRDRFRVESVYRKDRSWIPHDDIALDASAKTVTITLGPDVERTHEPTVVYLSR